MAVAKTQESDFRVPGLGLGLPRDTFVPLEKAGLVVDYALATLSNSVTGEGELSVSGTVSESVVDASS